MEEEKPDLIGRLPCEILQHIVSLIPLKEAIRSSILSTSWRSLWAPFQVNLEFDSEQVTSQEASDQKLKQVMGMFLRSYEGPQILKLSLCYRKRNKVKDELLVMAAKRSNRELHVDFSEEKQVISDFDMRLEPSFPNSCNTRHIETTVFSSIKTLHLRSITFLSARFVSGLFSYCWLLESLKLEKCNGLQNLNVKANNCLQSLIVEDCPNMASITISAPSLKSFWYRGVLLTIEMKSTPDLADVILNLKDGLGKNDFDCEDVLLILAFLKDVVILTISGWLLEWLCTAGVIFGRLEFQFNKLKELSWIDCLMDRQKRDSLACFLNITPFLEKLLVKIDQHYSPIPCPFFHQCWHEPHLWMDYATLKSNASQLKHLKFFNLVGFTSEEDQLLLVDLLLNKAVTLKAVTFTSPENHSWQVAKIPQSQLKKNLSSFFPKRMVVSLPNKECSFVLTEEDSIC